MPITRSLPQRKQVQLRGRRKRPKQTTTTTQSCWRSKCAPTPSTLSSIGCLVLLILIVLRLGFVALKSRGDLEQFLLVQSFTNTSTTTRSPTAAFSLDENSSNNKNKNHDAAAEEKTTITSINQTEDTTQQLEQNHPKPPFSNSINNTYSCAILFFGLPRAFATVVLPSIRTHVLQVNAHYGCDVYAHYYAISYEPPGRQQAGGPINATAVSDLLPAAVHEYNDTVHVEIVADVDEAKFWAQRNATLQHYRTAKRPTTGKLLYFPWADVGYVYPKSLDNIVKQWHSIEAVFTQMEESLEIRQQPHYDRIALLRLDMFYATPLDIFEMQYNAYDTENQYGVIPGFAQFPVNDRLFMGPYAAAKLWATQRFARVNKHVSTYDIPGYGMHSERFVNHTLLTAIRQELGVPIKENYDICLMRARADGTIWAWDCHPKVKPPSSHGSEKAIPVRNKKQFIESILHRNCTESVLSTGVKPIKC